MRTPFRSMDMVGKSQLMSFQFIGILKGDFHKDAILIFSGIKNILVLGFGTVVYKINIRYDPSFKIKSMAAVLFLLPFRAINNNGGTFVVNLNSDAFS